MHIKDSCNSSLPILANAPPGIDVYRCSMKKISTDQGEEEEEEECIWQEAPTELIMEGTYSVMKVIHRAEIVSSFSYHSSHHSFTFHDCLLRTILID